jgi:hypothetical protein
MIPSTVTSCRPSITGRRIRFNLDQAFIVPHTGVLISLLARRVYPITVRLLLH